MGNRATRISEEEFNFTNFRYSNRYFRALSLIFVSLSFEFQSLYFYAFQFSDSFSLLIYISFSAIIFSDSNSMQLSAYSDCCYFGGYLQDFVKDIEFSSLIFGVVSFFLGFCVFVLVLHWII